MGLRKKEMMQERVMIARKIAVRAGDAEGSLKLIIPVSFINLRKKLCHALSLNIFESA